MSRAPPRRKCVRQLCSPPEAGPQEASITRTSHPVIRQRRRRSAPDRFVAPWAAGAHHKNLNVSRGYYRLWEKRRRDAVDKDTAMQFDQHCNGIWRQDGSAAALHVLRRLPTGWARTRPCR